MFNVKDLNVSFSDLSLFKKINTDTNEKLPVVKFQTILVCQLKML